MSEGRGGRGRWVAGAAVAVVVVVLVGVVAALVATQRASGCEDARRDELLPIVRSAGDDVVLSWSWSDAWAAGSTLVVYGDGTTIATTEPGPAAREVARRSSDEWVAGVMSCVIEAGFDDLPSSVAPSAPPADGAGAGFVLRTSAGTTTRKTALAFTGSSTDQQPPGSTRDALERAARVDEAFRTATRSAAADSGPMPERGRLVVTRIDLRPAPSTPWTGATWPAVVDGPPASITDLPTQVFDPPRTVDVGDGDPLRGTRDFIGRWPGTAARQLPDGRIAWIAWRPVT
ncbi:MAG: hypothetical protein U0Q07_08335 [Acidimicrobiales bacterium]